MKINPDCMRAILKYCIEHIDYKEISFNKWAEKSVGLSSLYSNAEFQDFDKKEIMYSVMKLYEYNYITLSHVCPTGGNKYIDDCSITDVTIYGHNFYNSVAEDTIWNKTKRVVGQVGNHTLKFIEETAQIVASESAKQAVTIMMSQK